LLFSFLSTAYSQNIGINTTGSVPDGNALLDINADNSSGEKKGLLIPRMNTAERDALSGAAGSTAESILIYNTTTHCFEAWNQSVLGWVPFGCLNCQMPGVIIATTATNVGCNYFTANWSVSPGAAGYYLDVSTTNNFASVVPLSVGNVLAYPVTGLSPNMIYYYRVRAVNACGTSIATNIITVTTSSTSTLSLGCHPCQVEANYGTVQSNLSGSLQTWITQNLGATAEASSSTDISNAAAGCYFQFNRSQPYGYDTGGTLDPITATTNLLTIYDMDPSWLISNDPCRLQLGGAWRLPTYIEWLNANANLPWTSYTNTYASVLKLHAAGYVSYGTSLIDRGVVGYYWSSDRYGGSIGYSSLLNFDVSASALGIMARENGVPVRCVKD